MAVNGKDSKLNDQVTTAWVGGLHNLFALELLLDPWYETP